MHDDLAWTAKSSRLSRLNCYYIQLYLHNRIADKCLKMSKWNMTE